MLGGTKVAVGPGGLCRLGDVMSSEVAAQKGTENVRNGAEQPGACRDDKRDQVACRLRIANGHDNQKRTTSKARIDLLNRLTSSEDPPDRYSSYLFDPRPMVTALRPKVSSPRISGQPGRVRAVAVTSRPSQAPLIKFYTSRGNQRR